MDAPLHTAVETPTYFAAVSRIGLSAAERDAVLDQVMRNPSAGDLIRGSGGVRKVRIARDDTGKSGGYRILSYFMDADAPVFLLFVIAKAAVDNINAKQTTWLREIAKQIKAERNAGTAPARVRR